LLPSICLATKAAMMIGIYIESTEQWEIQAAAQHTTNDVDPPCIYISNQRLLCVHKIRRENDCINNRSIQSVSSSNHFIYTRIITQSQSLNNSKADAYNITHVYWDTQKRAKERKSNI
jgi:hypothetical protein